ncbi:hypothetical protein NDA17_001128 [Ustilago hordei]|nr:hypothetical protein NDA17_001128 [Ustilago hordei]
MGSPHSLRSLLISLSSPEPKPSIIPNHLISPLPAQAAPSSAFYLSLKDRSHALDVLLPGIHVQPHATQHSDSAAASPILAA